ncbi:MAG: serine/threonine protein kinase [Symploca sp. SIO2G7]|nr:serine/threonine protein kinase [Symploca sp. SIO2G7]
MQQSVSQTIHCINPDCPSPYPQPWGNKFCNGCGASVYLNNRYIPLQRLGSGGFATIYTVWDWQTQSQQVLKVLIDNSPKALQLFEQEATVLQGLNHPGIPRVEQGSYFLLSLGNPPQRLLPCLVMEKINGQTLDDVLRQYPQGCPETLVRDWLYQAIAILRELHRSGIIHRDLKPSNLMLQEETNQLVAIDFGGAKQISWLPPGFRGNSTRLISPGYSPPEQMAGEAVSPTADFYALGRTMIQLLTGQDLADLEDPMTGELQWRDRTMVTPALADLLDEMVRAEPQKRPANALKIQRRLAATVQLQRKSPSPLASFLQTPTQAIATLARSITAIAGLVLRLVISILLACLDTTWEMLLGGIGAATGTIAGLMLISGTSFGDYFADWLSWHLPLLLPDVESTVWQVMPLFAVAGLGTGWGLTLAGGFRQERRPLIAGLMGIFGYSIGWLIWQESVSYALIERLLGVVTAIAVTPLALGLGLPSHYLVHTLVAAAGTGTIFSSLVWLGLLPVDMLINIFSTSEANLIDLINTVAFFSLLGITIGLCLGVSYYVVVPILRRLGWN